MTYDIYDIYDVIYMIYDIIKIMPFVEGDRSDCQPEASSIARSRRLRAMVVVQDCQSDLSPSTQGMIVFITPKVYRSLTLFISVL